MTGALSINSHQYWNERFLGDWVQCGGRDQSSFFSSVAMALLPPDLIAVIKREAWSVCDWGCALGDGTEALRQMLAPARITGIDFSDAAINAARKTYPENRFEVFDVATTKWQGPRFDLVFSSNTLEHFKSPWTIASAVGDLASRYLAILVPYDEQNLHEEHCYQFTAETIARFVMPDWLLSSCRVIDAAALPGTHWKGKQVLLTYARLAEVDSGRAAKVLGSDWMIDLEEAHRRAGKLSAALETKDKTVSELQAKLGATQALAAADAARLTAEITAQQARYNSDATLLRAELAALKSRFDAAVSSHATELAALQSRYDAAVSSHSSERAALQQRRDADLTNYQAQIAARQVSHDRDVARLRAEIDLMMTRYNSDVELLRATTTALQASNAAEVERHGAELASMQGRSYVEKSELISKLEAKTTTIEQLESEFDQLLAKMREAPELGDVLSRLRVVQATRGWRTAKALQFMQTSYRAKGARGAAGAAKDLMFRVVRRQRIAHFDQIAHCASLIEKHRGEWASLTAPLNETLRLANSSHVTNGAGSTRQTATSSALEPSDAAVNGAGREGQLAEAAPSPPAARAPIDERQGHSGLVSIILPVYNQAGFLAEAIAAVVAQTYANWELIIVDDGSSDGIDEVIGSLTHDRRIRFFRQPNQKLPSALNNGFAEAQGEFFTWTSADNVMLPEQLEVLVSALRSRPDCGFAYSDYEAIDDRGAPLEDAQWRAHNRKRGHSRLHLPAQATVANLHESGDNFIGASFLWRAEVHSVVGQHDEATFGGEDYDFWLRMHLVTPFVHVPQSLYRYRVHDNTLNARAKELRIAENVAALLAADRARRKSLVSSLAGSKTGKPWRLTSQYLSTAKASLAMEYLSRLGTGREASAPHHEPLVLVVDLPLREIVVSELAAWDILVVPDKLTWAWLQRQPRPREQRLLFGRFPAIRAPLEHAIFLRREELSRGRPHATLPAATVRSRPAEHVLLMAGAWKAGGLEHTVLDLGRQLKSLGIRTTLGLATGRIPSELAQVAAAAGVEVVAFEKDANAVARFVRENRVDLLNYHHASLGAAQVGGEGAAKVYTFHNSYIWFTEPQRVELRNALRNMDAYVSVSRQVADYALRWFDVDPGKMTVVPNGFDPPKHIQPAVPDQVRTIGSPAETPFFISVGTFNRVKAQNRLVSAFIKVCRELPGARLKLIGWPADQAYHDEVCAIVRQHGLDGQVDILSGQSRQTVLDELRLERIFVLPSLVEGWSVSLMEAVACGLPVVATDVGSARDMAEISSSVTLVPAFGPPLEAIEAHALAQTLGEADPRFEDALASAMVRAWQNRRRLREVAQAAAGTCGTRYSMQVMAQSYATTYSSVLGRKASLAAQH